MGFVFDPRKDEANLAKHGLSLSRAAEVDILAYVVDERVVGETRFRAFGQLDGQACCLVYTLRDGDIRVISLRRAHLKEYRRHVPPA